MTLGDVAMGTVFLCGMLAGMALLAGIFLVLALFFEGAK